MKFDRKNDECAIVGFSVASRADAPWNNPTVDLFGINEEAAFTEENMKARMGSSYVSSMGYWKQDEDKIAGWFQLHPYKVSMREDNRSDPNHPDWLRHPHPYPIFMQDKYKDIPSSIKFPVDEIVMKYGYYFCSTISYVMLWAYEVGYKIIGLYGFELYQSEEYVFQRSNFYFWMGWLKEKGIIFRYSPNSHLLKDNMYSKVFNIVNEREKLEKIIQMFKQESEREASETTKKLIEQRIEGVRLGISALDEAYKHAI